MHYTDINIFQGAFSKYSQKECISYLKFKNLQYTGENFMVQHGSYEDNIHILYMKDNSSGNSPYFRGEIQQIKIFANDIVDNIYVTISISFSINASSIAYVRAISYDFLKLMFLHPELVTYNENKQDFDFFDNMSIKARNSLKEYFEYYFAPKRKAPPLKSHTIMDMNPFS